MTVLVMGTCPHDCWIYTIYRYPPLSPSNFMVSSHRNPNVSWLKSPSTGFCCLSHLIPLILHLPSNSCHEKTPHSSPLQKPREHRHFEWEKHRKTTGFRHFQSQVLEVIIAYQYSSVFRGKKLNAYPFTILYLMVKLHSSLWFFPKKTRLHSSTGPGSPAGPSEALLSAPPWLPTQQPDLPGEANHIIPTTDLPLTFHWPSTDLPLTLQHPQIHPSIFAQAIF